MRFSRRHLVMVMSAIGSTIVSEKQKRKIVDTENLCTLTSYELVK